MNKDRADALVARLETAAQMRCPLCLRRHTAACIEGGRCSHCGSTIAATFVGNLPAHTVETDDGPITFRADNARLARRVCRAAHLLDSQYQQAALLGDHAENQRVDVAALALHFQIPSEAFGSRPDHARLARMLLRRGHTPEAVREAIDHLAQLVTVEITKVKGTPGHPLDSFHVEVRRADGGLFDGTFGFTDEAKAEAWGRSRARAAGCNAPQVVRPMKTKTVKAGTVLFHGTDSAGDIDTPDGPAWFCHEEAKGQGWAGWSDGMPEGRTKAHRRLFAYEVTADVDLLDTAAHDDWVAVCDALLPHGEESPSRVAKAAADAGHAGWYGDTEVMLCWPAHCLRKLWERDL